MIKPIQTRYRNRIFRSRLEARYAVLLDSLRIEWEYEYEGFVLPSGECYLPDFWLPKFNCGMYLEVKPKAFTEEEKNKCYQLCEGTGYSVWMAVGTPAYRCYEVFYWMDEPPYVVHGDGIPNADQAEHENRMYGMTGYGEPGGFVGADYLHLLGDSYKNAVAAANAARFEHGDKG